MGSATIDLLQDQAYTGLTLSAQVYTVGPSSALAATVSLTESPAGSGSYAGTWSGAAASTRYKWRAVNAAGVSYGYGEFETDSTGNEITGVNVTAVNGVAVVPLSTMAGSKVYITSRISNGNIALWQGETWSHAEGTHEPFTKQEGDTWPTDLTGYTVTSTITKTAANTNSGSLSTLIMPCTVTQATGEAQAFYIETGTSTASLPLGEGTRGFDWTVTAEKGTNRAVLAAGTASVKRRL